MDKRNIVTNEKILSSFKELLLKQNYDDILIQDVISQGHIGRATLYAHYKNKDEILDKFCYHLFLHIFNHQEDEVNHSFKNYDDFSHILLHLFCHLKEDKLVIKNIINSSGKEIFLGSLNTSLKSLIEKFILNNYSNKDVRQDILVNHLVSSLNGLILYWINDDDCKVSEVDLVRDYENLIFPILDLN